MNDQSFNCPEVKNAPVIVPSELVKCRISVSRTPPFAEHYIKFIKYFFKNTKIPLRKVLLVTLRNEV